MSLVWDLDPAVWSRNDGSVGKSRRVRLTGQLGEDTAQQAGSLQDVSSASGPAPWAPGSRNASHSPALK